MCSKVEKRVYIYCNSRLKLDLNANRDAEDFYICRNNLFTTVCIQWPSNNLSWDVCIAWQWTMFNFLSISSVRVAIIIVIFYFCQFRKALFHDPDPVISYVPPLKTSKGGASDDEDRRVKEYLEGLWSLVQKSASKRTSCRPSDG